MKRKKIIGVIGASVCDDNARQLAYDIGKGIAENGYPLICGGLTGVMEGACHGAFDAGGVTIGVLPGGSADAANPYVTIPIVTGFGYARNVIIVQSASVLIAVHGGPGTLSEIAYALQFNVPVISVNSFDVSPDIRQVSSPEEALKEALGRL